MSGRNIALIGGAGFIGHHLALALKAGGDNPIVIDSLMVNNIYAMEPAGAVDSRYRPFLEERLGLLRDARIDVLISDARDYHQLSHILGTCEPQVVVHLAAVAHLDRSRKDMFSTFDHTLRTLENALDVSVQIDVEQFIFFSSSTVYGDFRTESVTEETDCRPRDGDIYAKLKFSGELIVRAYQVIHGLPYTIVRPSAAYGPRCVSGRIIQKFIEAAMEKRPLVMRGPGDERIDFTHVHDIVQGIKKIVGNENALNETFNITAGNGRPIGLLAYLVSKHSPFGHCTIERMERDETRPMRGTLDISKARRMLGYEPDIQLEQGVASYIEWYRSIGWSRQGNRNETQESSPDQEGAGKIKAETGHERSHA